MDGLEQQAQEEVERLLPLLYAQERVEIQHSSRDTVVFQLAEELKKQQPAENENSVDSDARPRIVTTCLVFRSGVSVAGLQMLQQTLPHVSTLRALEFVGLKGLDAVRSALTCCKITTSVRHLSLRRYVARRSPHELRELATLLRDVALTDLPNLKTLELVQYPLGSEGAQTIAPVVAKNTYLQSLRLADCNLRSDSATAIAEMIKGNTTLQELNLSYNRQYLGSAITREMTIKTLVRGLQYNLSLMQLVMDEPNNNRRPTSSNIQQRSFKKIDRQLDMNRFAKHYVETKDPFALPSQLWPLVLARVSAKPSALFRVLQHSAVAHIR